MTIPNNTIVRGPQFKPAYYRPWLRFIDGTEGADGGDGGGDGGEGKQDQQTFTQADLDKFASKVRAEERRKASERYADYDDLKSKADGAKTVEQKLEELQQKHAAAELRVLRSDVAAQFGISAEDRDLFLLGTDTETLTAQAKRLSEREADRKKQGNVAPREGNSNTQPADQERQAVRSLFGGQ